MKIFRRLSAIAALLCLLPLTGAIGAGLLAELHGCQLHEGFVNECIIMGADRGELLYGLFVGGWIALFTLPLFMLIIVIWVVVEIIHWVLKRRHAR